MATLFEFAVALVTQISLLVSITLTTSPSFKLLELYVLPVAPVLVPLICQS